MISLQAARLGETALAVLAAFAKAPASPRTHQGVTPIKRREASPGVKQAIAHAIEYLGEPLTLVQLARAASTSRFAFCRQFRACTGLSPIRWLWLMRTLVAAELFAIDPRREVFAVAQTCGFGSAAHFSRAFRTHIGVSPSAYRAKALDAAAKRQLSTPDVPLSVRHAEAFRELAELTRKKRAERERDDAAADSNPRRPL